MYLPQKMSVLVAIDQLCPDQLLKLTDEIRDGVIKHPALYHHVVDALCLRPKSHKEAAQIIYILRNYGHNINQTDKSGSTPLLQYLQSCDLVEDDVVEAMLRCNADVFIRNENNTSAYEEARKPHVARSIKALFARYMPGIWRAIAADEVHQVRFLVNQWCRVDIEQEGKSLLHLAFDTGTENIIGIISGIHTSMALAHGVLAGDMKYVENLLKKEGTINVNLKNMGDGGTTPLFYAALQNNTEIVKLLLSMGARVHCTMTTKGKTDLPLLFALMLEYPQVHASTLQLLIPQTPVHVETLHYKGKNILFHCVDCDIDALVVSAILEVSSAAMVTSREVNGLTAREYAEKEGCRTVVEVIDMFVYKWWMDKTNDKNRKLLALHSYHPIPTVRKILPLEDVGNHDNQHGEVSEDLLSTSLTQYQRHICKFHQALEVEDEEQVHNDVTYFGCDSFQEFMCDSRPQGDGQPALHKVVLRGNAELTQLLAETLVYKQGCRLDSVRDQFFRTALHYAYALENNKAIVDILVDHGASDFTMDKDGRSPLAFKDRRELTEMRDLLHYHLIQDFDRPEPDPWSCPLPIPILGYMRNCGHAHHMTHSLTRKLYQADDKRQISAAHPEHSLTQPRNRLAIKDQRSHAHHHQTFQPIPATDSQTAKYTTVSTVSENKFDSSENSSHMTFSDLESVYCNDSDYNIELGQSESHYDEVTSRYVIDDDDDDINLSSDDEFLDDEEELVEEESRRQGHVCIIL